MHRQHNIPTTKLQHVVISIQADSVWKNGNHQEAHNATRKARGWSIAGLITRVIIIVVLFIVVTVVASAAATA